MPQQRHISPIVTNRKRKVLTFLRLPDENGSRHKKILTIDLKKIMAKTATVSAKIDPSLKVEVETIFQELGVTTSEAIDAFFHEVKRHHRLPFEMEIPNKTTDQAIYEAERGMNLVVCENSDDMFRKLGI